MEIDVFISHSSKDAALVARLIELVRKALNLSAASIRCTSVDGYRLGGGTSTEEQLRHEVNSSRVFVGVISPSSLASAFVLFELGARWGVNKRLIPVLVGGIKASALKSPLNSLNALDCSAAAQVHQLVAEIGDALSRRVESPSGFHRDLEAVVEAASSVNKEVPSERVAEHLPEWVGGVLKNAHLPPGMYLHPDIPTDKLGNAQFTMKYPPADEVYALLDTTTWGSAKDGVLFGIEGIYYKNFLTTPERMRYSALRQAVLRREGAVVFLGDNNRIGCDSKEQAVRLLDLMNSLKRAVSNLGTSISA